MSIFVGYCQYHVVFGDWETNARIVLEAVGGLRGPGVLVLPELAFSGYDFPSRDSLAGLAEPFEGGPTRELLTGLAAQTGMVLVAGYAEREGGALYNSAMAVSPDGSAHNYRKLHLFNRETTLFDKGNLPPRAFDTPHGRIGMMVCFDWFFPEVMRCLALDGALLIAHPSNLVLPWCQRAMFTRCLENRVFAVTANRIGTETLAGRSLTFTGASQVLSPKGETLIHAPVDSADTRLAEVTLEEAASKQLNEYNNLFGDRRVDMFQSLTQPSRLA